VTQRFGPDEERRPIVPFVPYRCPACRKHRVKTYGQAGRVRYHVCLSCGERYHSLEIEPDQMHEWGREQGNGTP